MALDDLLGRDVVFVKSVLMSDWIVPKGTVGRIVDRQPGSVCYYIKFPYNPEMEARTVLMPVGAEVVLS